MSGPNTRYPCPVFRAVEPAQELRPDAPAKHTAALETQAFPGHDQDDAAILG